MRAGGEKIAAGLILNATLWFLSATWLLLIFVIVDVVVAA